MVPEELKTREWLGATALLNKAVRVRLEIEAIMEEVEHDLEVRQAMIESQRELGTLTPEEIQKRFTI